MLPEISGAIFTAISTNTAITIVSILAFRLISFIIKALKKSVNMQNINAPVIPNFENIQTIKMVKGIAVIVPKIAIFMSE